MTDKPSSGPWAELKEPNLRRVLLASLLVFGVAALYLLLAYPHDRQGENAPVSRLRPALHGLIGRGGGGAVVQVGDVRYLLIGDRAVTLFGYSASAAEQYAKALNRFAAATGPGVRLYSLLVPTSADFVDTRKYGAASDSQKDALDRIDERLDPRFARVNAYGALKAHAREYVYFRTDHHWTALGAYYAYAALMKTMGERPVALGEYETGEITGFLGTAYKATLSGKLKAHPDTIVYYKPLRNVSYTAYSAEGKPLVRRVVDPAYARLGSGDYAVFLGGDYPWGEIKTGNRNGRTIVVVKDSFGNALLPFLLPHFETVAYVDPRSYPGNLLDFVKEHRATDVLFLNSSTVARSLGIAESLNKAMGAQSGEDPSVRSGAAASR